MLNLCIYVLEIIICGIFCCDKHYMHNKIFMKFLCFHIQDLCIPHDYMHIAWIIFIVRGLKDTGL